MQRACSRATILMIGVFSDVKEDRSVMEDLGTRAAQEVLDDHLNLAENWGGEGALSASSRRTSAATYRRR
jgi:hypothetical protein